MIVFLFWDAVPALPTGCPLVAMDDFRPENQIFPENRYLDPGHGNRPGGMSGKSGITRFLQILMGIPVIKMQE